MESLEHCVSRNDIDTASNFDVSDDANEDEIRILDFNIWQDLWQSLHDCRYASVVAVVFAWYISYQITMAPYQTSRPVLTTEQRSMSALVILI